MFFLYHADVDTNSKFDQGDLFHAVIVLFRVIFLEYHCHQEKNIPKLMKDDVEKEYKKERQYLEEIENDKAIREQEAPVFLNHDDGENVLLSKKDDTCMFVHIIANIIMMS